MLESLGVWTIIIGICIVVWAIGKAFSYLQQRYTAKIEGIKELEKKLEASRAKLEAQKAQVRRGMQTVENEKKQVEIAKVQSRQELENIAKEKSQGFPWLAEAYADYFNYQDLKIAKYLEIKRRPARKAAEYLREIAAKRRDAEKRYRVLKYQLEYYENLFPWLADFRDEDIDDDLIIQITDKNKVGQDYTEKPDDPAKQWLTGAEYDKLSRTERNQLALDRYWQKRKKSKWQIGRDYERYIGYLYEDSGWSVYYQGIVRGLEDLGRDLIAINGDNVHIGQCKCWSQNKVIHEKHIFQLFGTTIEYCLKNRKSKMSSQLNLFPELLREEKISPKFFTSTKLSEKAKEFAEALHVQFKENYPLESHPCIKCNINRQTGEKIYHLPFDQQYDKTKVEKEKNECYVETVKEAEALGFRRAFRWKGESAK